MEYRILGRTGLRVSAVALGCEGFIHKTPEEVCADFDFAIGHGVNFIDIYSPNPELRTNIGAGARRPAAGTSSFRDTSARPGRTGSTWRTRDPGENPRVVRPSAATAADGLSRHRHDPLRRRRGGFSPRLRRGDHPHRAKASGGGANPPHRHQQPQSRGGPDGRRNGTGGRADVLGKPLLRPATGRATTSRPCGPRRVTPARCATSTPTANGSTNCAKGRAWGSTP